MKKVFRVLPVLKASCLLIVLLFLSTAQTHAQPRQLIILSPADQEYLRQLGPITVAPDPDWMPFEFVDEAGNFSGIAADLLELVATRLGIEFTYVIPQDWDQALEWSLAGDVLILPFLNQTPQREQWLVFTEPLLVDPNVFITRQEHPFITDATQLTNESIVLPSGTSIEERVRRDFPNLHIVHVESENDVFRAVNDREADMTLRSLNIAAYTIRKEGLFNLKIAGQAPDEYTNRLRMGVLSNEPRLRDILNLGIASITPAEREEIVNRHVNITIVQPVNYGLIVRVAGGVLALTLVSVFWNIRLRRVNTALQESERSKRVLLAALPGIAYRCSYDQDWTMEFISEGCYELSGYKAADLIQNRVISYNSLIHPDDRDWVRQSWETALRENRVNKLEYRIRCADGSEKWVFEQGLFIHDEDGGVEAIEGLVIDITERKHAEQELYRVSIHDGLTALYNRGYVMERLIGLVQEFRREHRPFSVVLLDLDHFKTVNDTYGHAAGDMVLREFARILQSCFRPYDIIGRHGGEEFIAVVLNSECATVTPLMQRLRNEVVQHPFEHDAQPLEIRFSAGVSGTTELENLSAELSATTAAEMLIDAADKRLYRAKRVGRDRVIYPDDVET